MQELLLAVARGLVEDKEDVYKRQPLCWPPGR